VKPAWRDNGIGTALLHWGEAKAREMHRDDPRPAVLLANASEGEQDAVRLLQSEGYRLRFVSPELAFDDFAGLPTRRDLSGIVIRPLQDGERERVARALCEANLDPPENGTPWQDGEREARVAECDPALSFAAWDGAEVAGAYLCNRNGAVGEIAQVAVRERWRGRGIARLLAERSLHALHAAGCVTARLFTSVGPDETEPTAGPYAMYRKFGFYPIARHLRFWKPLQE
jgi:GNAT superfamily N-acetyltransferase